MKHLDLETPLQVDNSFISFGHFAVVDQQQYSQDGLYDRTWWPAHPDGSDSWSSSYPPASADAASSKQTDADGSTRYRAVP